jgi:tRNA A37 threonylcarbamoyladenosine biosynthesis protein TsaE
MFHDIYHIDAYRIKSKDLLNLGWNEIISDFKNIIIVEWAERVEKIIPKMPYG